MESCGRIIVDGELQYTSDGASLEDHRVSFVEGRNTSAETVRNASKSCCWRLIISHNKKKEITSVCLQFWAQILFMKFS